MMEYEFHPLAHAEMQAAAQWYEQRSESLGQNFLDKTDEAIARARTAPEVFGRVFSNVRCARLHRFPYGLLYRIEVDRIFIIAVTHLHRDPDYWKDRL